MVLYMDTDYRLVKYLLGGITKYLIQQFPSELFKNMLFNMIAQLESFMYILYEII